MAFCTSGHKGSEGDLRIAMQEGNNQRGNRLTVVDPLGRRVFLSEATWSGHISHSHSEILNYLDDVKATLESPDCILEEIREGASLLVGSCTNGDVLIPRGSSLAS